MSDKQWIFEQEAFGEATHLPLCESDTEADILEYLNDIRWRADQYEIVERVLNENKIDLCDHSVGYSPNAAERVIELVAELVTLRKYFNIEEGLRKRAVA
jgi:hypothetical protein